MYLPDVPGVTDECFAAWLASRDCAVGTIEAYERTARLFTAFVGDRGRGLLEASNDDARAFLAQLTRRSASVATIHLHSSALMALRAYLCLTPFVLKRLARQVGTQTPAPTHGMLERLWDAAAAAEGWLGVRDTAMLRLAHAGLRVTRLITLDVDDVSSTPGEGLPLLSLRIEPGAFGEPRFMNLDLTTSEALEAWLRARKRLAHMQTGRVFVSARRLPITRAGAWLRMQHLAAAAGLSGVTLQSLCAASSRASRPARRPRSQAPRPALAAGT